ncbi:MAG TPA: 5'-3' exonuclease H3TH domain-containing protein, partial [Gemmatimonadaceae bacterium]|nr:5'-3' exonuclease H3TH domain-containing protein [Gemmatimonadaceae bacterium]
GVEPALIPDYLALVGDAQDGYPGIRGIGPSGAAGLLNKYGPIESFPPATLGADRDNAMLFKTLATLRTDAALFADVDEVKWRGPTATFADWAARIDDKRLFARAEGAIAKRDGGERVGERGKREGGSGKREADNT